MAPNEMGDVHRIQWFLGFLIVLMWMLKVNLQWKIIDIINNKSQKYLYC